MPSAERAVILSRGDGKGSPLSIVKEVSDILRLWQRHRGEPLALATLVAARGSSYRRPGARMLITADSATAGALSGGCLEEEVAACARAVLDSGTPHLLEFDTRRRFGCNGAITIFVERARDSFLAELDARRSARRSCSAVTAYEPAVEESGTRMLLPDEQPPEGAFVQEIQPPLRLIVVGDGPDSAPLRAFADVLGWHLIECEHASDLPTEVDERTAAVVKTHNYGRDCAALRHLLRLPLRYVALLGPRKRRDEIVGDLVDSGVALPVNLYGPAGLDVNAETPEEIALAIMAEIQAVFAGGSAQPLRERRAPIHGWNPAAAGCVSQP
jgi:xanthine/CO dehydrogenase XdhC/CoxF family maturation factor